MVSGGFKLLPVGLRVLEYGFPPEDSLQPLLRPGGTVDIILTQHLVFHVILSFEGPGFVSWVSGNCLAWPSLISKGRLLKSHSSTT